MTRRVLLIQIREPSDAMLHHEGGMRVATIKRSECNFGERKCRCHPDYPGTPNGH